MLIIQTNLVEKEKQEYINALKMSSASAASVFWICIMVKKKSAPDKILWT